MKRDQIEELFYGKPEQQRRFTQDFPILPDVWIEYGKAPDKRVEVLLTPHNESDAPRMARALRQRLEIDRKVAAKKRGKNAVADKERPRVLFNESVVLASLSFRELLRDAVPLTNWWKRVVAPLGSDWTRENIRTAAVTLDKSDRKKDRTATGGDRQLLQKLIRVVGSIELDRQGHPIANDAIAAPTLSNEEIEAFASVYENLPPIASGDAGVVWSISLNRRASTSVWRSRLTVKADAAARLFAAKTTGIRWAVLDTGIDATHKAFRRRNANNEIVKPDPTNTDDGLSSRVVRTYDFLRIKNLLDPDPEANTKATGTPITGIARGDLQTLREELRTSLLRGRSIDWDLLEPLLRVSHSQEALSPAARRLAWDARRRHPGRQLAGGAGGNAADRAAARRVSGARALRSARAARRSARHGGRIHDHRGAAVHPAHERAQGPDGRARRQPEPVGATRRRQLRVRPHAGLRGMRARRRERRRSS